jgi:RNA polymerase subunit RPABC4/transcription elongation factor Spt4
MQLFCLNCNRPNSDDAKFCAGCGAGLLRRFCASCHRVNDADAHFCQACGAALPTPEMKAPTPAPASAPAFEPSSIPNLTDVVDADSLPPHSLVVDAAGDHGGALAHPASHLASLAAPAVGLGDQRAQRSRAGMLVLVGAGGLVALATTIWVWTSSDRRDVAAGIAAPPAQESRSPVARAPNVDAAAREAAEIAARLLQTASDRAAADGAAASAGELVPPKSPRDPRDQIKNAAVRSKTVPVTAPPSPAATRGIAATGRPARSAATAAAAAPAECTPAMDAMSLCAPGAKPTGR